MENSSKSMEKYNADKIGEFKFFTTAAPGSVYDTILQYNKGNKICEEHKTKF